MCNKLNQKRKIYNFIVVDPLALVNEEGGGGVWDKCDFMRSFSNSRVWSPDLKFYSKLIF